MTKEELITEVTEFIKNELVEEDGALDLGAAAAAVENFISELDIQEDEDVESEGDDSAEVGAEVEPESKPE